MSRPDHSPYLSALDRCEHGRHAADGWMPKFFDGRWETRPTGTAPGWLLATGASATAHGTGRYEQRADGVIAEVYEVWPDVSRGGV